ncbi:MAG: hypothetical protein HYY16_10090 [Planctomycetes bacterium]|nr:hypothetical protein [Planctomycetota bacterium]
MYIRNRDEALDALSAVLALPERRDQIIQITVKVALCLDPDARRFLADCAAGLIEGGLDYMRRKRREMLDSLSQQEGQEAIILVDSSQDQLLEAVGSAMDALRLADIIAQVFPELARRHEKWEIARAVLGEEQAIQDAVINTIKERKTGGTQVLDMMQKHVADKIDALRPKWISSAPTLRAAVADVMGTDGQAGPGTSGDPELIFKIIALDDTRAQLVLDLTPANPGEAKTYVNDIRTRVDQILALEEQNAA